MTREGDNVVRGRQPRCAFVFAAGLLASVVSSGCDDDFVGEPLCIWGEIVACECEGGGRGVQLCLASGDYDRCSCRRQAEPAAGGGGQSGGEPDAGGSARPPGEAPPTQEPPPQDDPPAEPQDPPDEPPAQDPEPQPPADGALWGACRVNSDCDDNLQCAGTASGAFGGSGVGYCSERCFTSSGSGSNNRRDCTPPPTGSVEAFCSPLSTLCELGSCEDADCPVGMDCQELITPFGNSFECSYP